MISHDTKRGQSVEIEASFSILRLPQVTGPLDSGNYTCAPHNLRPDLVTVHILGGQGSLREVEETAAAAVQDDDQQSQVADFHNSAAAPQLLLCQMLCYYSVFTSSILLGPFVKMC